MPPALGAGCRGEVVASIPVGPDGVSYELEIEPWGPAALAVGRDGGLYVLDGPGQSVVVVNAGELTRLSLEETGVFALFDLALVESGLWVLGEGVFFRHGFGSRLVRFSARGDFDMAIDFPNVGLSDGVIGLAVGPEGRLWVELAGGSVGEVRGAPPGLVMTRGYPYPDGLWSSRWAPEGYARFQAGATAIELQARAGFDGIGAQLLGVNPDGSFVLMVFESGQADDLSRRMAMSVVWFDAGGNPAVRPSCRWRSSFCTSPIRQLSAPTAASTTC